MESTPASAAVEDEEDEDAEPESRQNMREVPENVYVVSDSRDAARVAQLLQTQHRDKIFGADTEVGIICQLSPPTGQQLCDCGGYLAKC